MRRVGNRATITLGSTATAHVYDANRSLPVVLTDGTLKYVYGLAYAMDSGGNTQTYHTDGLGSVRAITDGTGAVTQTFQTDEFGVPALTQGTSTEPFRYTGQQNDGETGFYDLRARSYSPTLGRFVSRDSQFGPISSPLSLNRYTYVGNNSANFVDPGGRCFEDACIIEGGIAAWYLFGGAVVATSLAAGVSNVLHDSYVQQTVVDLGQALYHFSSLSGRAKARLARRLTGIPVTAEPVAQGAGSGGRWWEYIDDSGRKIIVVRHPDGSVHVGTPKPQSAHGDGEPPKFYDDLGPDGEGFGHVGDDTGN